MNIRNVINFAGHPFSKVARKQLEDRGFEIEDVSSGVDPMKSMQAQVSNIVDKIRSIPVDGTVPFAITLPGLTELGVFIISELHGRTGTFPLVIQVRRDKENMFTIGNFTFTENVLPGIVNLEKVRLAARKKRFMVMN